MKSHNKEEALKIIIACAKKYNEHLLNKNLLFIAANKQNILYTTEVLFKDSNFLHLTGCRVNKDKMSASRFFDACINNKLSLSDFNVAPDGTTDLKLSVLSALMSKNLSANTIGEYNSEGIRLYTEKLVGGIKGCIGFITDAQSHMLVPNTVLNKDIRDCTKIPQLRILITYRKSISEANYSEIVYSAKKINWDNIVLPQNYEYLPKPKVEILV